MTTLQLQRIRAAAHPFGNRVYLQWLNPQPHLYKGVLVRRREFTYPLPEETGTPLADVKNAPLFNVETTFTPLLDNKILTPELTAIFSVQGVILSEPAIVSVVEPGNQWQVTDRKQIYLIVKNSGQLEVYGMSSLEDRNLRAETVYYYTLYPYKYDPGEYVFHRSNRVSVMVTGPYDIAGRMYRLLPAIYHRYDTVLPRAPYPVEMPGEDKEKGQMRRFLDIPGSNLDQIYSLAAAALDLHDLYRVDGNLLPLLAQWIGWDTDYNLEIFQQRSELRNAPGLYKTIGIIPAIEAVIAKCINRWKCRTKEFVHNVFRTNCPERLNLWTCQRAGTGQWEESAEPLSLDFAYEGRPAAVKDDTGNLWLFYHTLRNNKWEIWSKTLPPGEEWTASVPVTAADNVSYDKHPTAALQGQKLWIAWDSFNQENQTWEIKYKARLNGQWTGTQTFDDRIPGSRTQRKSPQMVVDSSKGLWLFWLEKTAGNGNRWQMKYTRSDSEEFVFPPALVFPTDVQSGEEPRVEKDLFVLYHQEQNSIWIFWARQKYSGNNSRKYWEIAYREKSVQDPLENWGPIRTLPKKNLPASYDDCEPAAAVNGEDKIELYWASNREGGWDIWNINLENSSPIDVDTAEMLINNPYSQRAPLPVMIEGELHVIYRSNQCISYESDVYRATETTDFRYSGCTTVDIRDKRKIGLYATFDDFRTYTYDAGEDEGKPTDNDWYARDTIGIYLSPGKDDQRFITRTREFIRGILERFLPIQIRAVFFINPPLTGELIYTYDFPKEDRENPQHIEELFFDSTIPEGCPRVSDSYEDTAEGWVWFHSWSADYPDHFTVDFKHTPIDTNHRTWHKALKAGG